MSSRLILLCGLFILVAAAGIWIWRLSTHEPMAGWRDFPWTYITESAMGGDESRVIINRGEINGPASVIDEVTGQTAWPAYIHPDPNVVPLIDGKPCIIPLIEENNAVRTPVLKALRRPLTPTEINGLQRFQIDEGRVRMELFRKEMGQ
jgi:hypothetical protein